jgi:hypothetical protein
MTFVPGEYSHQSFQGKFFNALCGQCHGAVSGHPVDVALNPDFITEASSVLAATSSPVDLSGPVSGRGAIQGAPSNP